VLSRGAVIALHYHPGDGEGVGPPGSSVGLSTERLPAERLQAEDERFYGALSLTFAGILYAALVTVAGVVVASLPTHGWAKLWWLLSYAIVSVLALIWLLGWGRGWVIPRIRRILRVPDDRG
jgi:hypothetical protein